ncbi:hypothetical protein CYMTET_6435 [Cymbomonas tetramitiformis]|uniref:Uncharacterized protein n=1 Tax=Cymbomonas tetramitiformis TaxID=36881 RepID=A0AAE0GX92_9CHLO|nr:hypothetical protein CYMTET_6435 [Cymbomonas tetramitiformis]
MHNSVQSLAARLASKPYILEYIEKGYPIFEGRSNEFVVSFLIATYLFVLMTEQIIKNGYKEFVVCLPPMLDAIWAEHLTDEEGYTDFCVTNLVFSFKKDVPEYSMRNYLVNSFKTLGLYKKVPTDGSMSIVERLMKNGMWWPELSPSNGSLVLPMIPAQEEKEKGSKKRALHELFGDEKAAPVVEEDNDLGTSSKKSALEK